MLQNGVLSDRERSILQLRYGIKDGISHSLEDIGKQFNLTREGIRKIEARCFQKLNQSKQLQPLKEYLN